MSSYLSKPWSYFRASQANAAMETYAVVEVNIEAYVLPEILDRVGGLILHQFNVNANTIDYNIVLLKEASTNFSIYRSDNAEESREYFNLLSPILPVLVETSPEAVTLDTLPLITEHIRTQTGQNLIHVAAAFNFTKCITKSAAFDHLDAQDAQGRTPLHVAIEAGKSSSVTALLALHPSLDLFDVEGNSVLHYAAKGFIKGAASLTEILHACISELSDHAYCQLVNRINESGQTALALACAFGQPDCVRELIRLGANLNGAVLGVTEEYLKEHSTSQTYIAPERTNSTATLTTQQLFGTFDPASLKDGGTLLHWNCSASGTKTENLSRCITLNVDVNALNWAGKSALHLAVSRADLSATLFLLSNGADVSAKDGTGQTPLHLVLKWAASTFPLTVHFGSQVVAIVQAILAFGGDVNALSFGSETGSGQQNISARHLVSTSPRSALRDQLLYVLHSVDAKRCSPFTGSRISRSTCAEGCSPAGFDFNGTPFDLPANVSLRSSPLYDSLLIGEIVESALKELTKMTGQQSLKKKKLKLLSLDGGGIRGLIMIQLMDWLERTSGLKMVDVFDWISGTSTGGILALMLASGFSVTECRQIYFRFKDEVFAGSRPHSSDKFEAFLQRYCGIDKKMSSLFGPQKDKNGNTFTPPRILIPVTVVDYFPPELKLFRSYPGPNDLLLESETNPETLELLRKYEPHSERGPSGDELVWRVARSTGAAPSFFSKFEHYLDGGLIANNPTLDLLSEVQNMAAVWRKLKAKPEVKMETDEEEEGNSFEIGLVVSLGTGLSPREPFNALENVSLTSFTSFTEIWQLGRVLIEQTTSTDSHVVERAQAWCAGLGAPYFRLNPPLSEGVQLNETDNKKLVHMLWQTMAYAHRHKDRLSQLVTLLES